MGTTDRTGSPPEGHTTTAAAEGWAGLLGVTLAAGCALLSLVCARHTRSLMGTSAGESTPALGLELTAVGAATVLTGWLTVVFLAGAAETLSARSLTPVRSLTRRLVPGLAPRVAAGLVGSVVVLASAGAAHGQGPATASPVGAQPAVRTDTPARSGADTLARSEADTLSRSEVMSPGEADQPAPPGARPAPDPGWRPTSPPGHRSPDGTAIELVSRGTAEPDTVVVRTGDTLWDIAARHLGPDADAAWIAQEWPRWHEANREAIGDDPDLLLPGTILVPPSARDGVTAVAS